MAFVRTGRVSRWQSQRAAQGVFVARGTDNFSESWVVLFVQGAHQPKLRSVESSAVITGLDVVGRYGHERLRVSSVGAGIAEAVHMTHVGSGRLRPSNTRVNRMTKAARNDQAGRSRACGVRRVQVCPVLGASCAAAGRSRKRRVERTQAMMMQFEGESGMHIFQTLISSHSRQARTNVGHSRSDDDLGAVVQQEGRKLKNQDSGEQQSRRVASAHAPCCYVADGVEEGN